MLTDDAQLSKVRELTELTVSESTMPIPQEQSIGRMNREITITKENLDCLWTALEYTRATINVGRDVMGKLDCFAIHKSRAHQSNAYLEQAIKIVNQLKGDLK